MMMDMIGIPGDTQNAHPDCALQISCRGPISAKVLKRPRTVGRLQEVSQNAAAHMTALPCVGQPWRAGQTNSSTRKMQAASQAFLRAWRSSPLDPAICGAGILGHTQFPLYEVAHKIAQNGAPLGLAVRRNLVNSPGWLSTSIEPPCCCVTMAMSARTIWTDL